LSYAAKNGYLEITRLLLDTYLEQEDDTDDSGRTPLSYASEKSHLKITKLHKEKDSKVWNMPN
jgi:ankyrin repeat protein